MNKFIELNNIIIVLSHIQYVKINEIVPTIINIKIYKQDDLLSISCDTVEDTQATFKFIKNKLIFMDS